VVKAERQTVPQLSMVGPRGLSQVYETNLRRLKIKITEWSWFHILTKHGFLLLLKHVIKVVKEFISDMKTVYCQKRVSQPWTNYWVLRSLSRNLQNLS